MKKRQVKKTAMILELTQGTRGSGGGGNLYNLILSRTLHGFCPF